MRCSDPPFRVGSVAKEAEAKDSAQRTNAEQRLMRFNASGNLDTNRGMVMQEPYSNYAYTMCANSPPVTTFACSALTSGDSGAGG